MPPQPRAHTKSTKGGGPAGLPKWLLPAAALGVAAIVVAVVLLTRGGSDGGPSSGGDAAAVKAALTDAGCTLQIVKALPGDHSITTEDGTSKKWNTDPPTSGPHYQIPATFDFYTSPANQAQLVHNLEHGAIVVQYGKDVSQSTIDQIRSFYDNHQAGTIVARLDPLADKIALEAWNVLSEKDQKGILAKCPGVDEKVWSAFFKLYQFKGPERFKPGDLMPGN